MTLAYNQGLYINNARYTYYIILSCTHSKSLPVLDHYPPEIDLE